MITFIRGIYLVKCIETGSRRVVARLGRIGKVEKGELLFNAYGNMRKF